MTQKEKEELEREIKKLKKDLKDYLNVFPFLRLPEEEKERKINQYLDDILERTKRLKNE